MFSGASAMFWIWTLQDWEVRISDFDKDNDTSSQAIVLNVPYHLSETLIYGKRGRGNQFVAGAHTRREIEENDGVACLGWNY